MSVFRFVKIDTSQCDLEGCLNCKAKPKHWDFNGQVGSVVENVKDYFGPDDYVACSKCGFTEPSIRIVARSKHWWVVTFGSPKVYGIFADYELVDATIDDYLAEYEKVAEAVA